MEVDRRGLERRVLEAHGTPDPIAESGNGADASIRRLGNRPYALPDRSAGRRRRHLRGAGLAGSSGHGQHRPCRRGGALPEAADLGYRTPQALASGRLASVRSPRNYCPPSSDGARNGAQCVGRCRLGQHRKAGQAHRWALRRRTGGGLLRPRPIMVAPTRAEVGDLQPIGQHTESGARLCRALGESAWVAVPALSTEEPRHGRAASDAELVSASA